MKKSLRSYFGGYDMTWKRIVIFAVIAGVYTGLINCVPFLEDTSFTDIAVSFEWWILFAVFIVSNCKKWWEASLKVFVFFLISQPLVYLVEVPFKAMGWGLFIYYKYWAIITVLTLPGAAIAFLIKKESWLSVAVLSVANCLLSLCCADYMLSCLLRFPRHLLSCIFSMSLAIFFVAVFLKEKKHRIAALAVVLISAVVFAAYNYWQYNQSVLMFGAPPLF